MMAGPGDETAVAAAGRGHLRASHADRDQTIDALKAAFVQGRLTKDEFDARVGQTLASRTYAELAAVTAGLPARPDPAPPPGRRGQRRVGNAARWGTSGLVTPAILAAAFAFASVPGGGRFGAMAFVMAFGYFLFWLSVGADMLWQWYCLGLPTARMCVRCAHTAASHRTSGSCEVRSGSVKVWTRCSCPAYVPPGRSPKTADRRMVSAR